MPKTHKNYDEEFKRRAVELYLKSNKSLKQVARELGVFGWEPQEVAKGSPRRSGRPAGRFPHSEQSRGDGPRDSSFKPRKRLLAPPARHFKKSREPTGRGPASGYAMIDWLGGEIPKVRPVVVIN